MDSPFGTKYHQLRALGSWNRTRSVADQLSTGDHYHDNQSGALLYSQIIESNLMIGHPVPRPEYMTECQESSPIKTHRGRDKVAAISQTTLSIAFSWMKMLQFRLNFYWSLFLRVKLTMLQHWFRYWLGAVQATSHYLNQWWLVYWRIYVSLGLNELRATGWILPGVSGDCMILARLKNCNTIRG